MNLKQPSIFQKRKTMLAAAILIIALTILYSPNNTELDS
jgi:hypothetical protein